MYLLNFFEEVLSYSVYKFKESSKVKQFSINNYNSYVPHFNTYNPHGAISSFNNNDGNASINVNANNNNLAYN